MISKGGFIRRVSSMGGFLIIVLIAFMACTKHERYDKSLTRADSLMNMCPDSALRLLCSLENQEQRMGKRQRMHWLLLLAKAQNKAYAPMVSDTVFSEVVDYYDAKGTNNDRTIAHYLLGCIYRDLNDAPRAIECFRDAVSCADTLAPSCDHATLMRIYGQMADIFFLQMLPEEEIKALAKSRQHALLAGDTVSYIKGCEMMVRPFFEMDDTSAVLQATQEAHDLYLKYGLPHEAAATFPSAIYILLQQRKYSEARSMMEEFEKESGLFENGEIERGRGQYDYSRGLYYQGIHMPDSAEFFFRRLLDNDYQLEACRGLMMLYCDKHDVDSVRKYTLLYEKEVEKKEKESQAEGVLKMQSLYDYSRNKQIAEEQRRKSARLEATLVSLVFIAVVIGVLTFLAYRSYERKKNMRIRQLIDDIEHTTEQLEAQNEKADTLREEVMSLKNAKQEAVALLGCVMVRLNDCSDRSAFAVDDNVAMSINRCVESFDKTIKERDRQLVEKQKEIDELLCQQEKYKEKLGLLREDDRDLHLKKCKIVEIFKVISRGASKRLPTIHEWEGFHKACRIYLPAFYVSLESGNLTALELQVALLTRVGFSNGEIAVLLDKTSQHISNLKSAVNQKLFGDNDTRRLHYNLKNKIKS